MFYNNSMFIECCNENNNNINHQFSVLFIICAADYYYVKMWTNVYPGFEYWVYAIWILELKYAYSNFV